MNLYDYLREYDDPDAIIIFFGEMHLYVNKKFVYDYIKPELLKQTYSKIINKEGIPIFICDAYDVGFGNYYGQEM